MKTSALFSLLALLSSGICIPASLAFPPPPPFQRTFTQQEMLNEKNERVKTVAVACYPDFMEITVKADMFEIGAPVYPEELRLGVVYDHDCGALAASRDEYKIVAGLSDCGTKHWMTESSLVYTNLLIYTPETSEDGLIRMEEAVIPIECHYERKYSLSSSPLQPTWIPFTATQSAVETLDFNFRIMTSDWLHERSSNVFYLGEPICMEASVRVGNHMDLRVFMNSCVATLYPDRQSTPRYDFIENDGCLVDSQLQGARSQFLPRTQDDKLRLVIDAFRFHQEEQGDLYITCQLTATPVTADSEKPLLQTKACTYVNGRWRSADGNDYLCSACGGQSEVGYGKPNSYGAFGPRSANSAASGSFWKSGPKQQVYEQAGPILVLPTKKSGFIPKEDVPPILSKMGSPTFYGSKWRSGMASKMRVESKTDLDKGLISPEHLLPSLEPSAHKDLTKDKNVTSKQEEDEEASGEDEAVTRFYTTVDMTQKMLTKPSVPSATAEPDTPATQADVRPDEKHVNVTMMPQQTEDQKPPEEKQPKK